MLSSIPEILYNQDGSTFQLYTEIFEDIDCFVSLKHNITSNFLRWFSPEIKLKYY